jgi:hypothetical protein
MRGVESVGDLARDAEGLIYGDGAVLDSFSERRAVDHLHHEIVRADIVERADVGMVERGHGHRFLSEAAAESPFGDLDGDVAVEARVARLVDLAHAAATDDLIDAIRAKLGAGIQRIRGQDVSQRAVEHFLAGRVLSEQRLHFAAQFRVAPAGFVEKGGAVGRSPPERGMIQRFDLAPEFG